MKSFWGRENDMVNGSTLFENLFVGTHRGISKDCPLNNTKHSMAIKKSELYSSLWSSCDELRGGMDASQYKDYVLVMLFIKYVSDKFADVPYAAITVPKGASFKDTHNARFVSLMDQFMPKWQFHRSALNRLPVRHEDWRY